MPLKFRYVVLTREMSQYMVKTPVFMEWYNWLEDMINGDESYIATVATLDIDKDGKINQDLSKDLGQKEVSSHMDFIKLLL